MDAVTGRTDVTLRPLRPYPSRRTGSTGRTVSAGIPVNTLIALLALLTSHPLRPCGTLNTGVAMRAVHAGIPVSSRSTRGALWAGNTRRSLRPNRTEKTSRAIITLRTLNARIALDTLSTRTRVALQSLNTLMARRTGSTPYPLWALNVAHIRPRIGTATNRSDRRVEVAGSGDDVCHTVMGVTVSQ